MRGKVTHLHSRWASCDSGRRQTSVSSTFWSCRPFWPESLDRFYQWWPDGSRRLGCVQLPQYGHEDRNRLFLQGGSVSTAGTMKKKKISEMRLQMYLHEANGEKHQMSTFLYTCDLCFSLSFTSLSTSFCLLLVSSCSRFSSSSLLLRSSSRACLRISISRSYTCHIKSIRSIIKHTRP